MGVEFIKKIRKIRDLSSYGLAQELGIVPSLMDHYEKKGKSLKLDVLCKLRKASRLSWNELGKLLDEEFLKEK